MPAIVVATLPAIVAPTLRVAARYRPLPKCRVVRSYNVALSLAIVIAVVELISSDVCRIFVQRSTDFRRTFVRHPFDICRTEIQCPSNFRLAVLCQAPCHLAFCRPTPCGLRPIILPSYLFIQHPFNFCPTFVWPSLDIHLTSIRCLFITGHSRRHTIFFKL